MDAEIRFRTLLLKLQDSLSDVDRQRLHFLIGSVIPRRLRDDPTINGTLNLLESLFDRGKITDQEFDFLIEAFEGIDRQDIAWRLRGTSLWPIIKSVWILSDGLCLSQRMPSQWESKEHHPRHQYYHHYQLYGHVSRVKTPRRIKWPFAVSHYK